MVKVDEPKYAFFFLSTKSLKIGYNEVDLGVPSLGITPEM